jgi:hypothetical protein
LNIIPIDSARGPGHATVNLRIAKAFTFGPAVRRPAPLGAPAPAPSGPAAAPGRYSFTFNIDARNVFNKVNRGNPVANLSSPLFGQVNSLAGGPFTTGAAVRRVDLQLVFAF